MRPPTLRYIQDVLGIKELLISEAKNASPDHCEQHKTDANYPSASVLSAAANNAQVSNKSAWPEIHLHGPRHSRLAFLIIAQNARLEKLEAQLLTKMIQAMKIQPENTLRLIYPAEAVLEPKSLNRALQAIESQYLVAMGKSALRLISESSLRHWPEGRGQMFSFNGLQVMPTHSLADLISDPSKKRFTWIDLQRVMKGLGIDQ